MSLIGVRSRTFSIAALLLSSGGGSKIVTLFDILFVVVLLYNVGLRNITQINDITKSVDTRGYVELASRRMWIVFVSSNNSG